MQTNNIDDRYLSPPPPPHETWKEMVNHLYADMTGLYESQSLLIRKEISEKLESAKTAAASFAIGGALLFMGLLSATATAIICLDLIMPLWASALIVTAIFSIIGIVMVMGAKRKLAADQMIPRQSIETLGEVKNTFKERINEFKHH